MTESQLSSLDPKENRTHAPMGYAPSLIALLSVHQSLLQAVLPQTLEYIALHLPLMRAVWINVRKRFCALSMVNHTPRVGTGRFRGVSSAPPRIIILSSSSSHRHRHRHRCLWSCYGSLAWPVWRRKVNCHHGFVCSACLSP